MTARRCRHRLLARWLPLAAITLLIACETSINPATGRRELVFMTPAEEREIDARVARQVESEFGLVKNEALQEYVSAVGQALAVHSPRQDVIYSFQVVEMEEPNAFALPGGHIYVSRGLLMVANSEAELANVLGHEIAHVAARHAAKQDAHTKTFGLATVLGDLMSGGASEDHRAEGVAPDFVSRYARNQEREADRIGQDIAVAAGVDPMGMSQFLQTLDAITRVTQGFSNPRSYFASHPATRERIAESASSAQARRWKPGLSIAPTREAYLARIDGICVGRPASEGVFEGARFLHPDLGFTLRFPAGWHQINQSSQVVGISPKRDGIVLLQLQGEGEDPQLAAQEYAEREGLQLQHETPIRIGALAPDAGANRVGLPQTKSEIRPPSLLAYRALAQIPAPAGAVKSEITWIAYDGLIYRLIGGMSPGAFRKYRGLFRKFASSFRPLTQQEIERITELRLRLGVAREGETLGELTRRTENEWDPNWTAVVNDLFVSEPLQAGQQVKIAVREPYRVEEPDDLSPRALSERGR